MRDCCWSVLCEVDVEQLVQFLGRGNPGWPIVKGGQPNRIKAPPEAVPVIQTVLASFAESVDYDKNYACLSRVIPGRWHGYHKDGQRDDWITRVHVPVVTNPACWFMWEQDDGHKIHFEVGKAYSFNTLEPHAFGNDGETERVHLTFDVLRA